MSSLNAAIDSVRAQLAGSARNRDAAASVQSSARDASNSGSGSDDDDDAGNVKKGGGGGGGGVGLQLTPEEEEAPILVYARLRPPRRNTPSATSSNLLQLDPGENRVDIRLPRSSEAGVVNHSKEEWKFQFNGIFDDSTTQEQIFDGVARRVVDNVLNGYNGTIFAYGQTGSGSE